MAWFRDQDPPSESSERESPAPRRVRTEGLWIKCDGCRAAIWKKDLEDNQLVCPKCGFHFKMDSRARLGFLFDGGEWEEFGGNLQSTNVLKFVDRKSYDERLDKAQAATGLKDAVVCAEGTIAGRPCVACVMEYRFIGGSMGAVVGEKITRGIERAIEKRRPLIVVSASGGARMMEGVISLMQMAKISAALSKLAKAKLPYISVLTDPTTGGVTASYAMLGDLNVAEPGALIGFAGPRVIEQTIRQKLPKGFQRSEFLIEHGMLDNIVPRTKLKAYIADSLEFFSGPVE